MTTHPSEAPAPLGITLYIAGPMSGLKNLNYPAFHHAAKELRAAGYTVLNPAENPSPCRNPSWEDWMRAAIALLIKADHVATLDGFERSKGALVEIQLAHGLGMSYDPVQRHLDVAAKMTPRPLEADHDGERCLDWYREGRGCDGTYIANYAGGVTRNHDCPCSCHGAAA